MRTTKAEWEHQHAAGQPTAYATRVTADLEDALEALRALADVAEQVVDSRESVDHRWLTGVDPSPMWHLEYEAIPRARALLEERQEAVV